MLKNIKFQIGKVFFFKLSECNYYEKEKLLK